MDILIVEDEPKTARLLQQLILQARQGNRVLATLDSIAATVEYLRGDAPRPELMFLDIELADGNCFALFEQIEVPGPIVFCTAYHEHALQAFAHHGVAYVLKPFSADDIAGVFTRLEQIAARVARDYRAIGHALEKPPAAAPAKSPVAALLVRLVDRLYPVALTEIRGAWIDGASVSVITADGRKHPAGKTLEELEALLPRDAFFRLNRQIIVHRSCIRQIEPTFQRKAVVTVTLPLPEKPIVSRERLAALTAWLEGSIASADSAAT